MKPLDQFYDHHLTLCIISEIFFLKKINETSKLAIQLVNKVEEQSADFVFKERIILCFLAQIPLIIAGKKL